MAASKIDQLRDVILVLADKAHRDRIIDLLNALEQDVGAATLSYAAQLVRVQAADALTAHSNPIAGAYASNLLFKAANDVDRTDWERTAIIKAATPTP
ncbi:hypothetical protein [Candidatus Viridilinea mediisalina]|uniref:Uncharacterized protein n=1 Tax=Candidatus Viridilinea mediisalina TaxID=2024553 RepID=A0A2A6RGM9_9CHLR|nr:hypothetical protein [Candidatus Viridilinea mediisalina]PDW02284.1 hypothetical protein CJ255_14745 [Candidatus Viridilinea mediisalina]